jgi:Xaa-Pro aminopeptidase
VNHAQRISNLAARLESPHLVTRLPNIRYLTGFTGSNAFMVVRPDGGATFITDGRYGELAESLLGDIDAADLVVYTSGMWDTISDAVKGLEGITLEADGVTWDFARTFADETGQEPTPSTGTVEALRRTKDAAEIDALRKAAAAGDAAFSRLADIVAEGVTEAELGWRLIDVMREHGGDSADWEPIVAYGPGASIPHYRSGRRPVGKGLLLLDYGCVVDGYHSDMSRTVWVGARPDEEMERVYRAVLESQEAGIAAVAPGVTCGDVDEACREVLRGYGYEKAFLHSTGHGVGLEIHEPPWVRRGNDDPLAEGDVITVEPGVYLPGIGGVRIEDMVHVTADGPEVLTTSHKEVTA